MVGKCSFLNSDINSCYDDGDGLIRVMMMVMVFMMRMRLKIMIFDDNPHNSDDHS